jgi:putative phosphoesterase
VRIAVIADTHMYRGRRMLPAACVDRLRRAELILHAGDLVTVSFLDWLRALGPPVEAVFGNVDEPQIRTELPAERVLDVAGTRIGMVHSPGPGAGRRERLMRRFPGCDAIVYGHTHAPVAERHGGVWLLNPGSPTDRRRSPARTMLELAVSNGSVRPTLVELGT